MTEEGIALFEQIIGGLRGKGLNPQGISMKFASVAQVGSQKPDGRAVMESSYENPATQVLLKGGAILQITFSDGKFRFVITEPSGVASIDGVGLKLPSLTIEAMENCLMESGIKLGGHVFIFKNKEKARKSINGLFPKQ